MKDRLRIATRPSPMVAGVFRVCHIAKRSRLRGEMGFTILLAARARRYVAIAGESAAHISVGDLVWVKGCVLQRGDGSVLVASFFDRIVRTGTLCPCRRLVQHISRIPWGGKSQ